MTILVIEDEVSITYLLKKGLEMEFFSVDVAHDGEKGLALAEKNEYDLIILDMMLPKMDGLAVCRAIRRLKINTPVIMLTARDTNEDKKKGFDAGADDYLVKPFSLSDLIERMRTLLKRKQEKVGVVVEKKNQIKLVKERELKQSSFDFNNVSEKKVSKNISKHLHKRVVKKEKIESNELNKIILDNAPVSIITIDKEGCITSANKYFHKFSNAKYYHKHSIFTGSFFNRENLVDDYKKLLSDGTIVKRENCYEKNSKGEDKYLKIIAVPIRNEAGEIEGAISMAIDNTENVSFKHKILELNNELERKVKKRTAELNEANMELAKVLELKSIFMADISHELRTSLTIIQGNMELMSLHQNGNSEFLESNHQILSEVKRMSVMLTDLTTITNSDANQILNYKRVDLDELISSVCKSLKVIADIKNVKIEFKKNIIGAEIMADENKLEKLLSNLVRNAIRYNNNNGWIKVWTQATGKEIKIFVEDNGMGIPQEHLPNIFERFYRVDRARTRSDGGSGLGLAICQWVAKIHGGKIEVKSKLGQGSVFSVSLPKNY
ncbi:MAG: Sensor histidine kinase [Parcubacteria group bacterium GW2011_GWE2_38_18]|nr:MAG: Sensor histidine kinase [Parcubacteria group bacterium GW2011_GWE2_38_18]